MYDILNQAINLLFADYRTDITLKKFGSEGSACIVSTADFLNTGTQVILQHNLALFLLINTSSTRVFTIAKGKGLSVPRKPRSLL